MDLAAVFVEGSDSPGKPDPLEVYGVRTQDEHPHDVQPGASLAHGDRVPLLVPYMLDEPLWKQLLGSIGLRFVYTSIGLDIIARVSHKPFPQKP